MKWIDVMRLSLGNLSRNKLRTILTVSGVVVGIGTIVFLVSLGYGLQALAVKKVANLNALTLITVNQGNKDDTALNENAVNKFKVLDKVDIASTVLSSPSQITIGGANSDSVVYGVDPKYFELEDAKPKWGKPLSESDEKGVVLSQAVIQNLNLGDPSGTIGKELNYNIIKLDDKGNVVSTEGTKLALKVIGITNETKVKYTYTPLSLLKSTGSAKYNSIKVRVKRQNDLGDVRKTIESMGYPTTSINDTVDQINSAFVIIQGVLGGFGLVALFVAAIGIFNTMTISLLERTHEIGIMKAIGGRDKDVARVFTMESSLIGLLGGFFGVFTGWLMGVSINSLANYMASSVGGETNTFFYIPISFAAFVVGFAFFVSTFAGIWPARRAARLDPLEALRYE